MRNREQLVARLALAVHPLPEFGGVVRVQRAERYRRHLVAAEKDVAVQIHIVRHRRPFVGTEGRELSRLVRLVRELAVFLPDRTGNLWVHQRFYRRAGHESVDAIQGDSLHFRLRFGL